MTNSRKIVSFSLPDENMIGEFSTACRALDMTPSEMLRLLSAWVVKHRKLPFPVAFKRTLNTRESVNAALDVDTGGVRVIKRDPLLTQILDTLNDIGFAQFMLSLKGKPDPTQLHEIEVVIQDVARRVPLEAASGMDLKRVAILFQTALIEVLCSDALTGYENALSMGYIMKFDPLMEIADIAARTLSARIAGQQGE